MKSVITVRYIALFFLFIAATPFSFSQKTFTTHGTIEGVVASANNKEGIEMAAIKLLNRSDSAFITGFSASHTGGFSFEYQFGEYILEASQLGYHKQYRDVSLLKKNTFLNLDTIYLAPNDIFLKEVEVTASIPPIQVRGDTIEFNAAAFKSDGSSVLRDLIKQIPGLDIDENGNLKANGKPISKILIDGKEYFGNDIGMALSNIQADMITKLQLFEKESEEAKASGIKDQDPEQVLNLVVKEEFKRSIFGDTKTGVGNKGRHTNRANVNKMHGDNQYALVGDINNINDSEYRYGNNFDDNINKSLGANFNIQESEKITINGSAQYNNNKSMDEYRSDSHSSILNQYSDRSGKGVNRRKDMSADASLDWKPDTLTTIYFRTGFGYNDGENSSTSTDLAQIVEKSDGENSSTSTDLAQIVKKSTTSSQTSRFSESNGFRINNNLMISRRLNNEGRNISLSLGQNYNKDDSKGTSYSEKVYLGENEELEVIDQVTKGDNNNAGYNFSVRYVEPLSKSNKIYMSYSVNTGNSNRIGDVRRPDPITGEYTLLDKDYSRTTQSYSLRQNVRMGFQHQKEKYDYNINMGIDPSYTRNKTLLEGTILENLPQNVVNFPLRLAWHGNLIKIHISISIIMAQQVTLL